MDYVGFRHEPKVSFCDVEADDDSTGRDGFELCFQAGGGD